jgi:hypothetical protein
LLAQAAEGLPPWHRYHACIWRTCRYGGDMGRPSPRKIGQL